METAEQPKDIDDQELAERKQENELSLHEEFAKYICQESKCENGKCKQMYENKDIASVEWKPYLCSQVVPPTSNVWQIKLVTGEKIVVESQHHVRQDNHQIWIAGNLHCPKCAFMFASVIYSFDDSRVPEFLKADAATKQKKKDDTAKYGGRNRRGGKGSGPFNFL